MEAGSSHAESQLPACPQASDSSHLEPSVQGGGLFTGASCHDTSSLTRAHPPAAPDQGLTGHSSISTERAGRHTQPEVEAGGRGGGVRTCSPLKSGVKTERVMEAPLVCQVTRAPGSVALEEKSVEEKSRAPVFTEPCVKVESRTIKTEPPDTSSDVESRLRERSAQTCSASGVKVVKVVWTGKSQSSAPASTLTAVQGSTGLTGADSRSSQNVTIKLTASTNKTPSQLPTSTRTCPSANTQYQVGRSSTGSTRTMVVRSSPAPVRMAASQSVLAASGHVVLKSHKVVPSQPSMQRTSLSTAQPLSGVQSVSMPAAQALVTPSTVVTLAVSEPPAVGALIGQPQVLRPVSVVSSMQGTMQSRVPAAVLATSTAPPSFLLKVPASSSFPSSLPQPPAKVVSPLSTEASRPSLTRASVSPSAASTSSAVSASSSSVFTSSAGCTLPSTSSSLHVSEPSSKQTSLKPVVSLLQLTKDSPSVVNEREPSGPEKVRGEKSLEKQLVTGESQGRLDAASKLAHCVDFNADALKILQMQMPQVDVLNHGQPVVTVVANSHEEIVKQIQRNIEGVNLKEAVPVIIIEHVGRGKEGDGGEEGVEEQRSSVGVQSGGAAFQCEECDYSSHNKYYLRQHTALVHSSERPFKCPFCDYAGKRSHSLREHLVVHAKDRPFECHHCNATFRKKGNFTNHIKQHTGSAAQGMAAAVAGAGVGGVRYQCPHCSFVSDLEGLAEHSKQHHLTLAPLEEGPLVSLTPPGSEVKPVLVKCSVCGCTAATMDAMRAHMWEHIPGSNQEADADVVTTAPSTEDRVVHSASMTSIINQPLPENAAFKCSECSFVSREASIFIKHMLSHKAKHSQEQQQLLRRSQEQQQQQQQQASQTPAKHPAMQVELRKEQAGSQQEVVAVSRESEEKSLKRTAPLVSDSASKPGSAQSPVLTGKENTCRNAENTPFIHDPVAKRFHCTLCGYTCEYQRTIKAHIWKHSGNKDIDYPMFQNGPLSVYDEIPPDRLAGTSHSKDSIHSHPSIVRILNSAPVHSSRPGSLPGGCPSAAAPQAPVQALPLQTVYTTAANLSALGTMSPGQVVRLAAAPGPVLAAPQSVARDNPAAPCLAVSSTAAVLGDGKYSSTQALPESTASPAPPAPAPPASAPPAGGAGTAAAAATSATPPSRDKDASPASDEQVPTAAAGSVPGTDASQSASQGGELSSLKTTTHQQEEFTSESFPTCQESLVKVPSSLATYRQQRGGGFTVAELFQPEPGKVESDQDLGSPGSTAEEPTPGLEMSCVEVSDSLDSDFGEAAMLEASRKVVVEAVDSVGSDFTGLRSQQSSPRQSDPIPSEDSGIASDAASPPKHPVPAESSDANFTLAADPQPREAGKSETRDDALTLLSLLKRKTDQPPLETAMDSRESGDGKNASSTEERAAERGRQSGEDKPKTGGICSSLLAVIEQLRERSVLESDADPFASGSRKSSGRSSRSRRGRGRGAAPGDDIPLEAVENIERLENTDGVETFRCRLCHYTSTRALFIRLHMRLHKSKQPSECSLCSYVAPSSEKLQEHMIQHCKVRTYQCKFCSSAFNYKSQLRAHMRAHMEREPHSCQVCWFQTASPASLRQHMRHHSAGSSSSGAKQGPGEEEAVLEEEDEENEELHCPHCNFSAASAAQLTAHASVHAQSQELLRCRECDFTAVSSRSLKSHMKRHTNDQRYVQQPLEQYKCNLCGYVCHHLPSLKSHMWRHAADKNYSYEFTNDIINAAIDYDWRQDPQDPPSETELLERVLTTERKISEGSLGATKPVCWVTFRCCQCGFETINKATLNIHMRSHSDIIQQTIDVLRPASPGGQGRKRPSETAATEAQPKLAKLPGCAEMQVSL